MVDMEEMAATREGRLIWKVRFLKKREVNQEDGSGSNVRGYHNRLVFSKDFIRRGTQGK